MIHNKFKGITQFGESTACEQLKANVIEFFKWGFLNIGGFSNVNRPTLGAYGGDFAILRCVDDPRDYEAGQVWEGARHDWVWESGLDYAYQPVQISGVYVDGSFFPSDTSGTYAHNVSYPNGQVIFETAISPTAEVSINYSYRNVSFYSSDESWFREILFNSYRVDDPHFMQHASGVWDILSENRIQLPAVVVETPSRRELIPLQVGGGQIIRQDILYHILAENTYERDKIFDVITYQKEATILAFDKNKLADNDKYPLDANGFLRDGALTYPDLVNSESGQYFWRKIYFKNKVGQEVKSNPPLFRSLVRASVEVNMPEI
jgi:hypothetical protein